MTKKNIPIAIGFAIITVSQLVLGIFLVVFAARSGGKSHPLYKKSHSYPEHLLVLLPLRSSTTPADTTRRISPVSICPA